MDKRKKRVLIVDDDAWSRERATDCLEREGFEVASAADRDEAFQAIEECMPDLVLLDLLLIGTDGFVLAKELKQNPATRHLPLIFITAFYARQEIVSQFADNLWQQSLQIPILHKPLQADELRQQISSVLEGRAVQEAPKRILVVDDDKANLELIDRRLEVEGFSTTLVNTAAAGKALLQSETFEAVLLDLRLPDQDGLAMLMELRKIRPHLPVLIMTAHGSESVAAKALSAGASDYLIKPVGRRELVSALRNAIERGQLQAEKEYVQKNLLDALMALQESAAHTRQEQQRLTGLLENLHEGVMVLDMNGQLERSNPAGLEILRQRHKAPDIQTLFADVASFRHEQGEVLECSAFLQRLQAGPGEDVYLLQWPDGVDKALMISMQPWAGEKNQQQGWIMVLRDFTRRRAHRLHLEALFQTQSATLQCAEQHLLREVSVAAVQAKGQEFGILSAVAAELRKPLNMIVSLASHLVGGVEGSLSPGQRQLVEQMLTGSDDLMQRVEDLLDFTRLRAGQPPMQCRPIYLDDAVQEMVVRMEELAHKRKVQLHVDLGEANVQVLVDRRQFQIILRQLLANAIQYTLPGGSVYVRVMGSGAEIGFEIEDTGVGMDAKQLACLLHPDVSVAVDDASKGPGLGLFLAKGLVELMDARLEARSEPGRGSVFRLLLAPSARVSGSR